MQINIFLPFPNLLLLTELDKVRAIYIIIIFICTEKKIPFFEKRSINWQFNSKRKAPFVKVH